MSNVSDKSQTLPRNYVRFGKLYANDKALLKKNPTVGFKFLNSAEMVCTYG